jgi:hypothetical protein
MTTTQGPKYPIDPTIEDLMVDILSLLPDKMRPVHPDDFHTKIVQGTMGVKPALAAHFQTPDGQRYRLSLEPIERLR